MIATMKIHERWSRISNPKSRATGTPFTRPPPAPGRAPVRRRGVDRGRERGRASGPTDRRTTASAIDDRDDHHPEHHRRLRPEREREELDEPVRGRVEEVRAAGEEQPVEDLERGVEREERRSRRRRRPRRSGRAPRPGPPDHQRSGWPERRAPATGRRARRGRDDASTANPANTPRTSRMWARSRSLSTGAPATSTSKSGGPKTRSARIASVAAAARPRVKPVHAAAWARPCSNATQGGLRNGRIATATITSAVATAVRTTRRCDGEPRAW